jgi:uncharacterized protein (DUF885 family)
MTGILGTEASRHFLEFADEFLKDFFEFYPHVASYMGLHEYDGIVPDVSEEAISKRIESLKLALAGIDAIDAGEFDPETRFDYDLLRQGIEAELFRWSELRDHTYNPMSALYVADVTNYIKRDYGPIEDRVRKMMEYQRGIPRVMQQVRDALVTPLAKPIIDISIQMFGGQAAYMRNNLPEIISSEVKDEALLADFRDANAVASDALEEFVGYLKDQLEGAKEDFAIGEEMFQKMLAYNEMVDLPLERVLEVGRANLEANKQAIVEVARQIDPDKNVAEVADTIAADHPTAGSLIPDTAETLEEIRQYLVEHDIVSIPSEVRCKVKETPEFMRFGFAFMDPPGPFEQTATDAYYYITPVENDWTETQADEWLRRFNYPTLRDVSVHEAYPGHYVHFLHAARVMSPIRKVFSSYSFVEGWAHYCEQMMVEEGYRGDNPLLHFAQLSEALLRNCRYVVSILMHTGRMTLDEATKFLMDNAYMEELPAQREALRGTFDPGYLNYTLGKLLILKLREDLKARDGDNFNLKRFHDQLLAFAYPPVPLLRKHFLGEDSGALL